MIKLAGMIDPAKVRALREAKGMTMEEAASRAGLSGRRNWMRYETGERTDPPISVVRAMARALGCKIEHLLADPESPRRH